MPNTLGHLGLQSLLTARLRPDVRLDDLRWVALGCVLPDVPWILRRLLLACAPGLDDVSLRAYAIGQSSLLASLLLAAACVCVAARPRRVAFLLGSNVVLHLLLDALQTKWGNGVLWLAPVDFAPLNLGWFWPESAITWLLTCAGLGIVALGFAGPAHSAASLLRLEPRRLGVASLCLALWLALPLAWMDDVLASDAHGLRTLTQLDDRTGAALAFDRSGVRVDAGGAAWIEDVAPQPIRCAGDCPGRSGRYSLRGRFETHDVFRVEAWHAHPRGVRDGASVVGLLGVAALWLRGARPRPAQSSG